MKTRICDNCGRNMSEKFYKVKTRDWSLNDISYRYLDICPACFVAFNNMAMEQHKKYPELNFPDTEETNDNINDVEKTSEIEKFLQSASEKGTHKIINIYGEVLSWVIIDNELSMATCGDIGVEDVINPRNGKTIFYINNKCDCAGAKSFVMKFMLLQ